MGDAACPFNPFPGEIGPIEQAPPDQMAVAKALQDQLDITVRRLGDPNKPRGLHRVRRPRDAIVNLLRFHAAIKRQGPGMAAEVATDNNPDGRDASVLSAAPSPDTMAAKAGLRRGRWPGSGPGRP